MFSLVLSCKLETVGMKGTEVPNPRRSSACDCTCVLTRIDHCLVSLLCLQCAFRKCVQPPLHAVSSRQFSADVTRMCKFDYYSTDHILEGSHKFPMYCGLQAFPLITPPVRSPRNNVWPCYIPVQPSLTENHLLINRCQPRPAMDDTVC